MFGLKFVVAVSSLACLIEFSQSSPIFLRGSYGMHAAFASPLYPHDNTLIGQWNHYKMIRDLIRDKFYLNVGQVPGLMDAMGTFSPTTVLTHHPPPAVKAGAKGGTATPTPTPDNPPDGGK